MAMVSSPTVTAGWTDDDFDAFQYEVDRSKCSALSVACSANVYDAVMHKATMKMRNALPYHVANIGASIEPKYCSEPRFYASTKRVWAGGRRGVLRLSVRPAVVS